MFQFFVKQMFAHISDVSRYLPFWKKCLNRPYRKIRWTSVLRNLQIKPFSTRFFLYTKSGWQDEAQGCSAPKALEWIRESAGVKGWGGWRRTMAGRCQFVSGVGGGCSGTWYRLLRVSTGRRERDVKQGLQLRATECWGENNTP